MTAVTAVARPDVKPSGPGPISKRWKYGWIGEIVVMVVLYRLYDFGREKAVGTTKAAFANARDIISAEKTLGIYWERPIQQAFLNADWFIAFWNIYYGTVHFVLPVVTLVWLFRKAPARYVRWRNTLLLMWAIAVLTFFVYPLMPPRLMPARYGYVDTAAEYYNFGPQVRVEFGPDGQPTEKALEQYGNPYAAMPSFHIGWSSWCLLALWPMIRRKWVRGALVAYVIGVLFCITVTANHWLLDAVGGLVVLGLGYAGSLGIEWVTNRIRARRGEPAAAG
jgi:hypothetical protein